MGGTAGWRRLLRGIRARRWSSLTLLLTGALTVAAATLGPLYARAAQEAVLQDALTSAPANQTGLHAQYAVNLAVAYGVDQAAATAPKPGFVPAYPSRILGARVETTVVAVGGTPAGQSPADPQATRVVWRQGQCGHLVLVQGRCPTAPGEAVLSQRTVQGDYGYRLGGQLQLPKIPAAVSGLVDPTAPPSDTPTELTVVGVYRPADVDDPFWFGRRYFNAALSFADGTPDTVDAVFVDRSAYQGFGIGDGTLDVDYPLDATKVRLSDRATFAAGVEQVLARDSSASTYVDEVGATIASIDVDNDQVRTGSLLVSLQLAALALFVLFTATADALDGRGGDVALAKLRGLAPFATLRFLLAETLLLLVLAVPLGALLGLAATHVLAGLLLTAGLPVVVPGGAWVAAGAAFVGAALAAAVAGRRVVTRSVLDQWRGARRGTGRGRRAVVGELVVAAAAVAGLVLLATGSHGALTLLAPGLFVLAVALIGVRLVPLVVRAAVPRTAGSPRLGRFLAVRQVARRPAALRLAVLLAVATGLAVFGVAGESVAAGNRSARAEVETGAPRTVTVQFATDADPLALTAAADPDGRWAMATATWLPAGGGTVTGAVEGVDPHRLAQVGFPTTHGPSLATIARDLAPAAADPVTLRGTTLALTVTTTDLTGPAPYVEALLQPPNGPTQRVRIGTLSAGRQVYTGTVPCARGCRLVGVGWTRPSSTFDPIGATTLLQSAAVSSGGAAAPVDLRLDQPAAWRARSPDATDTATSDQVGVTADGVRETFSATGGGSAGLARASGPSPLPVWASTGAVVTPPTLDDGSARTPEVVDTFANAYPVRSVGTTDALPGVKVGGVVADVNALRDQLPGFTAEASWSVWLGPDAPADALDRLRSAGFDTGTVGDEAVRAERLGRQGPALALALLLACAVAAAVLATGATATAIATSGRRRSFELAALRVLGVSPRALTRATVLEQALLLGSALVLGVPSGLLAATLTMPVIPQFSDTSPLPLGNTPDWWPVVATAAAFVVLLAATAVLAGVSLVRAAVPARLRETTQ